MKDKFQKLSPFLQLVVLILIGIVSFVLLSMITTSVVSGLYPDMPLNNINVQRTQYPVQFMMLYYFTFQCGFLLIPGIVFYRWSSRIELSRYTNITNKMWSVLLFVTLFLILPVLSEVNIRIADLFGIKDALMNERLLADQEMSHLLGSTSDLSFIVGLGLIGILTGIAEELAFRKLLFGHMLHHTRQFWLSVIGSAFLFALLHFNYLQFLPLMSFGIGLSLIYYYSGSIWLGAALHAMNNMLNLWWLSTDSFPGWMEEVDLKTTIPSTLLLMGLIYYQFFRKRSSI